nr:hypothetical protein Iba_chr10cCG2230 [Ipomoea batatas]
MRPLYQEAYHVKGSSPVLPKSAGNNIKTDVGKEYCSRACKQPIYSKWKIPARKFITNPSSLETQVCTSNDNEYQSKDIYRCNNGLCKRALQDSSAEEASDNENQNCCTRIY